MKPNSAFLKLDKNFWACVRTISEDVGYTEPRKDAIKAPTVEEIALAFEKLGLNVLAVRDGNQPTALGSGLRSYFEYRAAALDGIKGYLQDSTRAAAMFEEIRNGFPYACDLTMNKQKGSKKTFAYLTCTVKMLLEASLEEADPLKTIAIPNEENPASWIEREALSQLGTKKFVQRLIAEGRIREKRFGRKRRFNPGDVQRVKPHCDYDPRTLTTVTWEGSPFRTLSRRVDGAYPGPVNPIAIWEIKEYYYTTTFGSRIADGIYETLLDGAEIEELRSQYPLPIHHYLFVDAYETWWTMGKSYLCRLVDSLHMGYVDEVIFGREALSRIPVLAKEWVAERKTRANEMSEKDLKASLATSKE
jgi:excisionase family DNA binding protein